MIFSESCVKHVCWISVSFWDILSPNQLKLILMIQVMINAVIKVMMYVVIIEKELE